MKYLAELREENSGVLAALTQAGEVLESGKLNEQKGKSRGWLKGQNCASGASNGEDPEAEAL